MMSGLYPAGRETCLTCGLAALAETPGGGDEADVGERLRVVAAQGAGGRVAALGQQAQVAGVLAGLVEPLPGAIAGPAEGQAFHQPVGADQETNRVVAPAPDQAVAAELTLDDL